MIPFYVTFAEPGHCSKPPHLAITNFVATTPTELLPKLVDVVYGKTGGLFVDLKTKVTFKATLGVITRIMYSESSMLNKHFSCWYFTDSEWRELDYNEEDFMALYGRLLLNANNVCYLCGIKGHDESDCPA